jgi:tetratricopeptide (TPR) repeat protein
MLLIDTAKSEKLKLDLNFGDWNDRVLLFWKHLLSHSAGFVALGCVVAAVVAFFFSTTDKIVIGPFSVPEEYEERGYSSEAISNAVVQFIHGNESTVSFNQPHDVAVNYNVDEIENIADHVDGKHVVSSFEQADIPDVNVPFTTYTFETLINLLRETVGRRPTRIAGEIVALRESDGSADVDSDLQNTSVLIRYKIEYPEPSQSFLGFHWWSRRTRTITHTLPANGAEEVVRKLALVTADGLATRSLPGESQESRLQRLISRGNIYFGLGDYDRAARMYERANAIQRTGHAYLCLGAIQEHKGNYEEAERLYSQAKQSVHSATDDDVDWAFLYWGNLLLREKKFDEAKAKYQSVTASSLEAQLVKAAAFNNLGFIEVRAKNMNAARADFGKAMDLAGAITNDSQLCLNSACDDGYNQVNLGLANQLLARIHYGHARLLAASQQTADLKTEYLASIQANPGFARSHYQLSRIYLAENNFDKGVEELLRTIQLEPGFAPAYGDWENVVKQCSKPAKIAKSINPRKRTLATQYKKWGDSFARAGNPDEANGRYCHAAQLDPTYKSLCPDELLAHR